MEDKIKKVNMNIYNEYSSIRLYIDEDEKIYDVNEIHYRTHGLILCRDQEINKYEEFIPKLTHNERLKFYYDLAQSFKKKRPKLCVAEWLIEKIAEEEAVSFINEFEYKGKENEATIAELKEKLIATETENNDLKKEIKRQDRRIEELTIEKHNLETKTDYKFVYKEDGMDTSINLSLRERTLILYGIILLALKKNNGDISPNLKRLIGNYDTISSYLTYMKKDGSRSLTYKEKEHIHRFYHDEELDTTCIKDYLE